MPRHPRLNWTKEKTRKEERTGTEERASTTAEIPGPSLSISGPTSTPMPLPSSASAPSSFSSSSLSIPSIILLPLPFPPQERQQQQQQQTQGTRTTVESSVVEEPSDEDEKEENEFEIDVRGRRKTVAQFTAESLGGEGDDGEDKILNINVFLEGRFGFEYGDWRGRGRGRGLGCEQDSSGKKNSRTESAAPEARMAASAAANPEAAAATIASEADHGATLDVFDNTASTADSVEGPASVAATANSSSDVDEMPRFTSLAEFTRWMTATSNVCSVRGRRLSSTWSSEAAGQRTQARSREAIVGMAKTLNSYGNRNHHHGYHGYHGGRSGVFVVGRGGEQEREQITAVDLERMVVDSDERSCLRLSGNVYPEDVAVEKKVEEQDERLMRRRRSREDDTLARKRKRQEPGAPEWRPKRRESVERRMPGALPTPVVFVARTGSSAVPLQFPFHPEVRVNGATTLSPTTASISVQVGDATPSPPGQPSALSPTQDDPPTPPESLIASPTNPANAQLPRPSLSCPVRYALIRKGPESFAEGLKDTVQERQRTPLEQWVEIAAPVQAIMLKIYRFVARIMRQGFDWSILGWCIQQYLRRFDYGYDEILTVVPYPGDGLGLEDADTPACRVEVYGKRSQRMWARFARWRKQHRKWCAKQERKRARGLRERNWVGRMRQRVWGWKVWGVMKALARASPVVEELLRMVQAPEETVEERDWRLFVECGQREVFRADEEMAGDDEEEQEVEEDEEEKMRRRDDGGTVGAVKTREKDEGMYHLMQLRRSGRVEMCSCGGHNGRQQGRARSIESRVREEGRVRGGRVTASTARNSIAQFIGKTTARQRAQQRARNQRR
ncbi:hypothetical protein BC939DRAFT_527416 [Gamsiella multidivaricata]|uniref:uncharacterized protein n=1 Tax=Gamsiella multidivaricata TaxID=101098 RepID=UPI00221E93F2|nr:uncharacterized protein BC939DRAFT_527416 [Gamsiella multidivaricata]KAI7827187.1 hypothetical protein BC939DRAFT_527416 [Gamsiella multidivaricata]